MTYKNFAISLAKEAVAEIRKNFGLAMKKTWKDNDTPVTKTDIAINKKVISQVKKYFPTHGILGEEESYNHKNVEYLWVCDPVDGTIPFSHGVPICTFSLALVKNGKPVVGAVYDPFSDRMFYAEVGKGAYLNNKKISVSKLNLKNSVLAWEAFDSMGDLRKQTGSLPVTFLSYVYGAMMVASGEFVGALYNWRYAHDAAAVKVIVEEAGGKVTSMFGKEQNYNGKIEGCLATNGIVHNQLLKIIKKHYKKAE